jgi:hypothetical protein
VSVVLRELDAGADDHVLGRAGGEGLFRLSCGLDLAKELVGGARDGVLTSRPRWHAGRRGNVRPTWTAWVRGGRDDVRLLRVVERSRENAMFVEDCLAREHPGGESEDPTAPPVAGGAV